MEFETLVIFNSCKSNAPKLLKPKMNIFKLPRTPDVRRNVPTLSDLTNLKVSIKEESIENGQEMWRVFPSKLKSLHYDPTIGL